MVARVGLKPAALAILLASLCMASCFLGNFETFPAYLTEAKAATDISDVLKSHGFTGEYQFQRMEYLTSATTGESRILIAAEAEVSAISWQSVCIVLDSDLDTVSVSYVPNIDISGFLGVNCNGNFLWGSYAITAAGTVNTGYTSPAVTTVIASANPQSMANLPFLSIDIYLGAPWSGSPLYYAASAWSAGSETLTTSGSVSMTTDTTATTRFLDACRYGDQGGSLLFSKNGQLVLLSYTTAAAIQTAISTGNILDSSNALYGPNLSYPDSNQVWVTADGVVMLNWNQDGKLVRYGLTDFSEQDSRYIDRNSGDVNISFSSDGNYWLYLNKTTGKLYKLGTWWK